MITGTGGIVRGHGRLRPVGPSVLAAESMAAALRRAVDDRRTRAILLRIDSRGGSAAASEVIWREVLQAREAGKPVVVSMGNVAASGGYYIACAADRVLAHGGTLTGSIGVIAGKAVVTGLTDRLGVTTDEVHAGSNALMWSSRRPFTERQRAHLDHLLDHVYSDFVAKVAQGRRLRREQVEEVAGGRVWTGADAVGRGLVDGLGGYLPACTAIRQLLGLPADAPLRLLSVPQHPVAQLRAGGARAGRAR